MNHFESGISMIPSRFDGNTNTNSNETIHDIKNLLRPGLLSGPQFKVAHRVELPK